jgi:hypothetical protein
MKSLMWPARAAIRPVPSHAIVSPNAVEEVATEFSRVENLESRVDRAFLELDAQQPAVARYLAREVDRVTDETAQALGHFLGVAVHSAFVSAFGARLRSVDDHVLDTAVASMEWDEELRRGAPDEVLVSDDVVAIGQPHVVAFVREQLEAALEADENGDPPDVDLEAVAAVYRAVLVEITAFSQAVSPPRGVATTEILA